MQHPRSEWVAALPRFSRHLPFICALLFVSLAFFQLNQAAQAFNTHHARWVGSIPAPDDPNLRAAFDAWAQYAPIPPRVQGTAVVFKIQHIDEPGVAGMTWTRMSGSTIVECEITIDPNWYTVEVVRHEVGHCLGLDHSFAQGALMSSWGNGTGTIALDDQAGIQSLYGYPASTPTPTPWPTTPSPTPSLTPTPTPSPTPTRRPPLVLPGVARDGT